MSRSPIGARHPHKLTISPPGSPLHDEDKRPQQTNTTTYNGEWVDGGKLAGGSPGKLGSLRDPFAGPSSPFGGSDAGRSDSYRDTYPFPSWWSSLESSSKVVSLVTIAMLLCNLGRLVNAVTQTAIGKELGLSMTDLATFQSVFLLGNGGTQLAAGYFADKLGGAQVMFGGLLLWSLALMVLPLAVYTAAPYLCIAAARGLFGVTSGVAIPAVGAIVGQWVPGERKASALSTIYFGFHLGAAVGPVLAGPVMASLGWPAVYYLFGALGATWALAAWRALPPEGENRPLAAPPAPAAASPSGTAGLPAFQEGIRALTRLWGAARALPRAVGHQLGCLAYIIVCYNFCFFTLQAWIPVHLEPLFGDHFALASAAPWLLSALVCLASGRLADAMIAEHGWSRFDTRMFFLAVSALVPGAALALTCTTSMPAASFLLLMLAVGAQATFVSGYHAHVQDVAPRHAGTIVGLTNALGIFASSGANIVVGYILDVTGSFNAVFLCTSLVYVSMYVVAALFLRANDLF